ncbi:hypothetical protein JTB14_037213 [Gonioctena quinquepunctata]|nr:hypothetical protein JTB14_037213 [Gonioctena quinquepunctata]
MAEDDVRDLFKGLQLRADMDVTVASAISQMKGYDICEVFKPGIDVEITVRKVGEYRNGTFSCSPDNSSFYVRRKNLTGVLIRTGNTVNYSFEVEAEYSEARRHKEIGTFGKFDFQLFLILKQIHNFQTCFFFRNPGTVEPGAEVLKPFSVATWYATIGSGFLMGIAMKIAYWIEYKYLNTQRRYSFFTSMVITISILAQQGSAILPKHLGGRIIFLNILIISMLLYNYYTSSLVSSLLSSKPTVFATIKELYDSHLKIGTENQPYTITYIIQQKNNELIQKLNSTKIYDLGKPNFVSPEDGVALVKEGGYAYHTLTTTAYPLIARSFERNLICDLAEINFLSPGIIGLIVQKKSQYKELFQISLMKMKVSGIYKRENDIWSSKKPECLLSSRILSVGVNELFLVYLILFAGVFISAMIFIIEIIHSRMIDRNSNPDGLAFING